MNVHLSTEYMDFMMNVNENIVYDYGKHLHKFSIAYQ